MTRWDDGLSKFIMGMKNQFYIFNPDLSFLLLKSSLRLLSALLVQRAYCVWVSFLEEEYDDCFLYSFISKMSKFLFMKFGVCFFMTPWMNGSLSNFWVNYPWNVKRFKLPKYRIVVKSKKSKGNVKVKVKAKAKRRYFRNEPRRLLFCPTFVIALSSDNCRSLSWEATLMDIPSLIFPNSNVSLTSKVFYMMPCGASEDFSLFMLRLLLHTFVHMYLSKKIFLYKSLFT